MGVNGRGDVAVVKDGDIFGDSMNVAAAGKVWLIEQYSAPMFSRRRTLGGFDLARRSRRLASLEERLLDGAGLPSSSR